MPGTGSDAVQAAIAAAKARAQKAQALHGGQDLRKPGSNKLLKSGQVAGW